MASVTLVACSPARQVKVEERSTVTRAQETERLGGSHIRLIQPGDTLYAIAFANGVDPKYLAAWNNLKLSDKLFVGRQLRLTPPVGFVYKPQGANKVKTNSSSSPDQNKSPTLFDPPKVEPLPIPSAIKWRWPTLGRVVEEFDLKIGRQGIYIAGSFGQPINASRAGEVVYVGNGLKGYGNLVILKHDDEYLSAYAQNLETFVLEGQSVIAGQRIATMGQQNKRVALHFQIRFDGEPVDPRRYLPKK